MLSPIQVYREVEASGLRDKLKDLEVEELLKMVKQFMPDMTRKIYRSRNKETIINYIVFRSSKLAVKGNVFLS